MPMRKAVIEYAICPSCLRTVECYPPRGGDGSARRCYRHKRGATFHRRWNCDGNLEALTRVDKQGRWRR